MLAILGIVIYVFGMVWQTISIVYIYRSTSQYKRASLQFANGLKVLTKADTKVSGYEKLLLIGGSHTYGVIGNRHVARARIFNIKAKAFKYGGWYCVIGLAVWFLGTALHL